MSTFDEIKDQARHKWLEYHRENRYWIEQANDYHRSWVKTPDGGRRPDSFIILAAVTALEPRLIEILPTLCDLNPSAGKIIEALGLDFDPDTIMRSVHPPSNEG